MFRDMDMLSWLAQAEGELGGPSRLAARIAPEGT
jgi:hypothetical protein